MTYLEAIILLLVVGAVALAILSVVALMPEAIDSWKQLRQRNRLMTVDDVVSYDTCVEREQAAFDAALDKALDAIDQLKFITFEDAGLDPYDTVYNRALDAAITEVKNLSVEI